MSITNDPPDAPAVTRKMIRKFREQIHALGALWIILGGLAGGLVVVSQFVMRDAGPRAMPLDSPIWLVIAAVAVGWIVVGVAACLKQLWAVHTGLVLSYLSLVGQVVNLNICGGVIVLIVILQAHRVIGSSGGRGRCVPRGFRWTPGRDSAVKSSGSAAAAGWRGGPRSADEARRFIPAGRLCFPPAVVVSFRAVRIPSSRCAAGTTAGPTVGEP